MVSKVESLAARAASLEAAIDGRQTVGTQPVPTDVALVIHGISLQDRKIYTSVGAFPLNDLDASVVASMAITAMKAHNEALIAELSKQYGVVDFDAKAAEIVKKIQTAPKPIQTAEQLELFTPNTTPLPHKVEPIK